MTMILVTAFVSPGLAVQPDEILKDAALEARARALSAGLRCLVCQNQSIDDSDAPLARDLRILIRERLTAGETDAQVINFVVIRYGDFVLLRPRFTAQTVLLWATPFAVLFLAALFLFRRRKGTAANEAPLSAEERAALDHFLHAEELAEQSAASLEASGSGRTLRGPASPGTSG
jgi:cytochrome c-type biogenesis protein CcmH